MHKEIESLLHRLYASRHHNHDPDLRGHPYRLLDTYCCFCFEHERKHASGCAWVELENWCKGRTPPKLTTPKTIRTL